MAFNTLEYLEAGKVEFVYNLTSYDFNSLIKYVRASERKNNIINGFLAKLKDMKPRFCFEIIYDNDDYYEDAKYLLNKHYSLDSLTKEQLEHNRRRNEFVAGLDGRIEHGKAYIDASLHEAWENWCRSYAADETRVGTEISLIVGTLTKLRRSHSDDMMRTIFDFIYQYKRNGYETEYNTVLEQVNIFSEHGELFVKKMHELEQSAMKGTQLT